MISLVLAILLFQQTDPDLTTVISRAAEYVSQYESELGNLIGTEEYSQTAVWLDNGTPPRVARRMQRRSSSDFLIIQVGPEWYALRKTNRVDGIKVKEVVPNFEEAFDNSPEANSRLLRNMKSDSTEHNLGDVQRDINLPTFALKVLRQGEASQFTFERAGTARISGVAVWRIRFRETAGPGLVVSRNGQPLYSNGTLWIEPETGRVLQTEFEVENTFGTIGVKGRISVTYSPAKNLPVFVPTVMVEHYESKYHTVDCRADYTNFRTFEVDVKFEIRPPTQ